MRVFFVVSLKCCSFCLLSQAFPSCHFSCTKGDPHCNTVRKTCDIPRSVVFCSESIECFPGAVSKFFLKTLVTIPVAPIITGIILHFRFHIRCIFIRYAQN
jgi:hypothetical protein